MENQHRLIKGYRELNEVEINNMNLLKGLEAEVLTIIQKIEDCGYLGAKTFQPVDGHWMQIARTHIQQGFMAAGRAVARPEGYEPVKPTKAEIEHSKDHFSDAGDGQQTQSDRVIGGAGGDTEIAGPDQVRQARSDDPPLATSEKDTEPYEVRQALTGDSYTKRT